MAAGTGCEFVDIAGELPVASCQLQVAGEKAKKMVGENLDLTSEPDDGDEASRRRRERDASQLGGRPFLGVHFVCCDVYSRIYVNRELTAYQGHCPKCSRPIVVKISAEGSDSRFFEAG